MRYILHCLALLLMLSPAAYAQVADPEQAAVAQVPVADTAESQPQLTQSPASEADADADTDTDKTDTPAQDPGVIPASAAESSSESEAEPAPEAAPDAASQPMPEPAQGSDSKPKPVAKANPTPDQAAAPEPTLSMTMAEVITLLQQQQDELQKQKQLLASQEQKISNLTRELDTLRAPPPELTDQQVTESPSTVDPAEASSEPVQVATAETPEQPLTQKEQSIKTGEEVAKAQSDDPTRALMEDFTGAWRLPGTDAALAIGGFVKSTIVYNNDPLEIKDRFIVGSIPVGDDQSEGIEAQSSLTASQSRLNFDLREPTDYGILRAFIEGDFAGEGDTFRLRHAFGQWKKMTAGKTWSAFQDTQASPEEVDFEGLNGRINVRQSQIRVMPTIGEHYELQFSLEDPNPQVQNATGVNRTPDLVIGGRFHPTERLHLKLALLAREIRAQREPELGSGVEKELGWGTTLSGSFGTPLLDERDKLLFQLNLGNGIGRYVNDLSSVGSFDGIINPDNGDLKLFDVISGYASWQHWWGGGNQMRSNLTFGFVEVDNPGFVEGDAYKRTLRASSNLFWSPTPRIDIGGEYLWGNRENEDGQDNSATQIQFAVRYRF